MKKRKYVTGRALMLATLFSAFTLPGMMFTQTANAAPMEQQQSGVITGTVIDETGETVIGATVTIRVVTRPKEQLLISTVISPFSASQAPNW